VLFFTSIRARLIALVFAIAVPLTAMLFLQILAQFRDRTDSIVRSSLLPSSGAMNWAAAVRSIGGAAPAPSKRMAVTSIDAQS